MKSAKDPQGNYSVLETMLGQRVGPPLAQREDQALAVNQHTRKLGVVIHITLYHARCKALIGPFTCRIVRTIGTWPTPAADEVVP